MLLALMDIMTLPLIAMSDCRKTCLLIELRDHHETFQKLTIICFMAHIGIPTVPLLMTMQTWQIVPLQPRIRLLSFLHGNNFTPVSCSISQGRLSTVVLDYIIEVLKDRHPPIPTHVRVFSKKALWLL